MQACCRRSLRRRCGLPSLARPAQLPLVEPRTLKPAPQPLPYARPPTGDTLFPVPSGGVSFMLSFPNLLPLPAQQVARIGRRLEATSFARLYGPFPRSVVRQGAAEAVQRSVRRYCGILDGSTQLAYT